MELYVVQRYLKGIGSHKKLKDTKWYIISNKSKKSAPQISVDMKIAGAAGLELDQYWKLQADLGADAAGGYQTLEDGLKAKEKIEGLIIMHKLAGEPGPGFWDGKIYSLTVTHG